MNKKNGIIRSIKADLYEVDCEDIIYSCKPRGRFRLKDESTPMVGDIVDISINEDINTIEKIYDRKNHFARPPLSNVDLLFIVVSLVEPKPNLNNIDQLMAICNYKNIDVALIFNKCDLADSAEYIEIYKRSCAKIFTTVATKSPDISEMLSFMQGKTSAFIGNTGVGKSSVLNLFLNGKVLKTGEISKKLGRGKHTTRHVELYKIAQGTYVADTPGFSTVDFTRYNLLDISNLAICFPEFIDYIGKCQYNACLHDKEQGCAIIEAVEHGNISKSRYMSYCSMVETMKNYKPWENKNDKRK